MEYLESQKTVHPEIQDQYAQFVDLYRKKYVHTNPNTLNEVI